MAPLEDNFSTQMRDLEREFAAAAAKDGHVYLPNFTPGDARAARD